MKHVLILSTALLIIAGLGYVYKNYDRTPEPIEAESFVASQATLTPLSADVTIAIPAQPDTWQTVREATTVQDQTNIKTSAQGRAVVTSDTTIVTSINSNTELVLSLGQNNKHTTLDLVAGETWSKIERALEQDEIYEIYTPTTVAAVRGTSFGVLVTGQNEKVIVSDGTVATYERDPQTGALIVASLQNVTAGQTLVVSSTSRSVRETTDEDRTDWYYQHNDRPTSSEGDRMIQIDPPALIIPARQEPASAPVATEPIVTEPVDPVPEPIAELLPLEISDVRPESFTYGDIDRISVYGDGVQRVDRVEINKDDVYFLVNSEGVLKVFVTDLPNEEQTYDMTVFAGDESYTVRDAFTVLADADIEPELVVRIDRVTSAFDSQTESTYVRVVGVGMDGVDTVLVNGQIVDFSVFSNTELHIFDTFYSTGITVEVRASSVSDSYVIQ